MFHILERYVWEGNWSGEKVSFLARHLVLARHSCRGVQRLGRAGTRRFRPRGDRQNSPFRGWDYMIPYMVGKLAPNSSHLTKGLVKYVPGRGYFRAVSSQNGDGSVTSPPPPIVERVCSSTSFVVSSVHLLRFELRQWVRKSHVSLVRYSN